MVVRKSEEQRYVFTGADSCISMDLFWPGKKFRWLVEVDAEVSLGSCYSRFKIEGLVVDSSTNTPHDSESPSSIFSFPLKSHERE